ncbi:MAG TPA: electron transport complex subunit RsxA [archaeon]|nr:electron transport complex subunit RsxA [archaeon]
MNLDSLFLIVIGTIFINNFVLSRFLGLCPFLGVSRSLDSAFGMGMAVIFVMTIASFVTWPIYHLVLVPYGISYLRTIVFILVIASLVQFVELVMLKTAPALYQALGIFLPLITTNCAILGVAVLNIDDDLSLIEALVQGFSSGVGFTLALLLMAGIRERLELGEVPVVCRGVPIAIICAGLMSIAFLGFAGFSLK